MFNGRDLSGWINVNCAPETWAVKDGIVTLTAKGAEPFLGYALGKPDGPTTVSFRFRIPGTGHLASHVDWLAGGPEARASSFPCKLKAGTWEETSVTLPTATAPGIVRLYLPAQDQPVELDWIEIHSGPAAKRVRMDF